ncbi:carboxylating nicotinate-nucleotide diphosphorylase [Fidelibacter multiformis]|uniref:carboxylating nicotinate-nucleotide diphosphorylase n=1 Tax=Fidelibacter multiformis TaxID=3377529 RepID=UPI0037DC0FA8
MMTDMFTNSSFLKSMIDDALAEDIQDGDITCKALDIHHTAEAHIVSKQQGVLCGISVALRVFQHLDSKLSVTCLKKDRDTLRSGEYVLTLKGSASSILSAERTALNFMGHLSGIATLTRAFVREISHTRCKILDTRKTTPLYRSLEKYAVSCGGGENHRKGLWDMILIKENHIRAVGDIDTALKRVVTWNQQNKSPVKIEIEVTNLEEFRKACNYPIDMIMLDHFTREDMKTAVKSCPESITLEASGNVTLKTVRSIAETGVHFISSGTLTHSAPQFDFSLLFDR